MGKRCRDLSDGESFDYQRKKMMTRKMRKMKKKKKNILNPTAKKPREISQLDKMQ